MKEPQQQYVNVEYENAVLGAVLTDGAVLADIRGWLQPDDFHNHVNEAMYRAILALDAAGVQTFDLALVVEGVKAGGVEKQPNSCNLCHYHKNDPADKLHRVMDRMKEE